VSLVSRHLGQSFSGNLVTSGLQNWLAGGDENFVTLTDILSSNRGVKEVGLLQLRLHDRVRPWLFIAFTSCLENKKDTLLRRFW
jgi:hypothetical protein